MRRKKNLTDSGHSDRIGDMNWMTKLALCALSLTPLNLAAQHVQTLPVEGDDNHAAVTETLDERNARMDWWRKAKFGMFIHYGLYSGLGGEFKGVPGGAEWIQKNLELDTDTYAAEAAQYFRPAPGCTEAWAELAREAGCRYMVMTTKHHEGFAMFDTKLSDYSSQKLIGRDIVREFVDSARSRGMKVGFYHSVIDWHHPDYDNSICPGLCYPKNQEALLKQRGIPRNQAAYIEFLHGQVRELLTQYGDVAIMWWDYSQGAAEGERAWKAPALIRMCHELQPGIIMNNRLYSYSGFDSSLDGLQLDLRCGDYTTPEKRIPAAGYPGLDWESCMTVGDKWGYNRYDANIKSPAVVIGQLQECAAKGGNLLLNIGPKGDGSIPEALVKVFKRVGAWMRVNGESIYESEPCTILSLPDGLMASMVGEQLYIFLPAGPRTEPYEIKIKANQLNSVEPSVLGQPDCKVGLRRVEEPREGADEPEAFLIFTVPAEAWTQAVEGMPVLRLEINNA